MSDLKERQYGDSSNFRARIELHRRFGTNPVSWPLWVFDNMEPRENARVLELGCGNGLFWKATAGRVPAGWKVIASDFSPGMLADAKKNIGDAVADISLEVVDAEHIQYENKSFDSVIANHMLYHIPDRPKALSEIRRVLKDDGVFYATTMSGTYMKEMRDILREYYSLPSGGDSSNSTIGAFSLENGEPQLREQFTRVELNRYENTLRVTEAAPFVDYVMSCNDITPGRTILAKEKRDSFTAFVQDIIERNGHISFAADAGMFVCANRT